MNDQERMEDLLLSEKKMSDNYDIFASECANTTLRDEFIKIFTQGHQTQTELFQAAQQRGWYQVEQAPEDKVNAAYQKYSGQRPQ